MLRRTSAMLLATASLVGAGVAMGAPAQAVPVCTPDNACFYSDANFTGFERDDFTSRSNWSAITYDYAPTRLLYAGDGVADNVSSVNNMDPDTKISVYYNSGYAGPCFKVAAYGLVDNFAKITLSSGRTANDNMNSHNFSNNCAGNTYNIF
ncbi:peptidase inhibitor family I36 protein [Streptomyces sp. NBC_01264]|uniref:peptidase inhibitor family I36 protein n=1 Tax=Streptomyces sp. NBC_01264 TaxID=2903804 RepID=UPI0022505D07|nr:peptidase inhibitor family I36 protein [Streptomyces sp. NBC_01264]MCX4783236.1 peptidase inhibitor family I36 protein [Streptomyces sp. NBC_01264]